MIGIRKPRSRDLGADFAGVVEAVGAGVEGLVPGDEVYGHRSGAFAEYVLVSDAVVRKPANLSFEEAAAVPVAAFTALQGLRDHAKVRPGQRVLVNGASGGVGTFAVQVAKALGATVDAVCSTSNVAQARELGADRVFDYTREDFTRCGARYDVVFDVAGKRSWRAMRRVLAPGGTVVLVGGPRGRLLGPLGHIARVKLAPKSGGRTAVFFIAEPNSDDLVALRHLIEAGELKPVIERRYGFAQLEDAMRRIGTGHAHAKLVVRIDGGSPGAG